MKKYTIFGVVLLVVIAVAIIVNKDTLNSKMAFIETTTQSSNPNTSGLSGGLAFEQGNNRILGRDENAVPRLIIRADGISFDMKVSKPTEDVLEAGDDELIFNSNQNLFKIVYTGTLSMGSQSVASGSQQLRTATYTFPTPFTSPPAVIAYASTVAGDFFLWSGTKFITWGVTTGSGIVIYRSDTYEMSITNTRVNFNSMFLNGENLARDAPAYTIKYYILQESIN